MAYYGIYRGNVVNTDRLQVNVPAVAGAATWALPAIGCDPADRQRVGDVRGRQPSSPVWMGCMA